MSRHRILKGGALFDPANGSKEAKELPDLVKEKGKGPGAIASSSGAF